MKRFGTYLLLQGKRALRLLPRTLAVTLLLTLSAALILAVVSARRASDVSRRKTLVGVIAMDDNPYIMMGIHAMETFDAMRDEISFLMMEEEPEALQKLRAGEIAAYVVVPEGFVDMMYTDDVHPLRFVTLAGVTRLDSLLAAELAEAVAKLMIETQNAQYGAIHYAMDHVQGSDPYEADDVLIDRYFAIVFDRDKLFRLETVGLSGELSFGGYYLCGVSVAFLLLWGIGACPLFTRRSEEVGTLLSARGFGAVRQVAGEFGAFYFLMLCGALCAGAAGLFLLRRAGTAVPELPYVPAGALIRALAFLVLTLGSMQFFLYELVPENPGGILLQFLNAAVQSFAAGCFYPSSFFPDGLRRFGEHLPAGTALRYLGGVMSWSGGGVAGMLGWTALFLTLSAAVRRYRQTGRGA